MASNSVFISYRREVSGYPARAVFQDLRANGIDAFMDIESIDSGQFDKIILNQIAARPYFVLLLGPGCLERCDEPGDWLRREIETAMELQRTIIPLLTSGFSFNAPYARPYLTGKLAKLTTFNAVNIPLDYFDEAMARLRTRFLKPIDLPLTATPRSEQAVVQEKIEQAAAEPRITERELTAQGYFDRALAHSQDDLSAAIADFDAAIRIDPQFFDAYYHRSLARKAQGNDGGAKADYKEYVHGKRAGSQPQDAAAYNNRGAARHKKGDLAAAIADYDEAIRLNQKFTNAYINRGDAYDADGIVRRAAADYAKALELEPKHPKATALREYVAKHAKDKT